jgi:ubiquinol oxidase
MIGYFEDEAVKSYTEYLDLVQNGKVMNIRAPQIAIDYYNLKKDARLSDLIISVRADEMHHADVNHSYADNLNQRVSKKSKDKKAA